MNRKRTLLRPEVALAGIGASSAAAFGVLAATAQKPHGILGDLKLRQHIPRYGRRTKKAVTPLGSLAKEWSVLPGAGLVGAKLLRDGNKEGAIAVVGSTLAAIAASHILLPQSTPPPGRKAPFDPHFPSGHALHSTAFLAATAWVFGREGSTSSKLIAAGAGALAGALGVDRLIHDRHWTSDVVGGWLAAIAIASAAASVYEISKRKSAPKKKRAQSQNRPARKGLRTVRREKESVSRRLVFAGRRRGIP
jgi:membrane-associated phospholipid phosphatase